MKYDKKSQKVTVTDPDKSNDEDISERIINAKSDNNYIDDLDDLLSIIGIFKNMKDEAKMGISITDGRRIRQKQGSPVKSNRFM